MRCACSRGAEDSDTCAITAQWTVTCMTDRNTDRQPPCFLCWLSDEGKCNLKICLATLTQLTAHCQICAGWIKPAAMSYAKLTILLLQLLLLLLLPLLLVFLIGQFFHSFSRLCQVAKSKFRGTVGAKLVAGWMPFLLPNQQRWSTEWQDCVTGNWQDERNPESYHRRQASPAAVPNVLSTVHAHKDTHTYMCHVA